MKKWLCIICGLIYDEEKGWPADGIAPGTRWEDVPDTWLCPDCLVGKADFEMIEIRSPIAETHTILSAVPSPVSATHDSLKEPVNNAFTFSDHPIVIIGSGHAGINTAIALRKQSSTLPIVLFTENSGAKYSKPKLSLSFSNHHSAEDLIEAYTLDLAKQYQITFYPHTTISEINSDECYVSSKLGKLTYSKLVIATGASPLIIPKLHSMAPMYSINNLEDYARISRVLLGKKKIAILGEGLIGCEFANDLTKSGHEVNVIGLGAWPMARSLPQTLGQRYQQLLANMGIKWHLNTTVSSIVPDHETYNIVLENDESMNVDLIISAVGLTPNTSLAKAAGLNIQTAIMVDGYSRTSNPNIYAIGDCAESNRGWMPFISPINEQIEGLVTSILALPKSSRSYHHPVTVKTPDAPLCYLPVSPKTQGEWEVTDTEDGAIGCFYDNKKVLRGFVLLGRQAQVYKSTYLNLVPTID